MHRLAGRLLLTVLALGAGCGRDDLSNYSLGAPTYPGNADCKQAYYKSRPIAGIFLKRFVKADGARVEGIACHDANIVVDIQTGRWREGKL